MDAEPADRRVEDQYVDRHGPTVDAGGVLADGFALYEGVDLSDAESDVARADAQTSCAAGADLLADPPRRGDGCPGDIFGSQGPVQEWMAHRWSLLVAGSARVESPGPARRGVVAATSSVADCSARWLARCHGASNLHTFGSMVRG